MPLESVCGDFSAAPNNAFHFSGTAFEVKPHVFFPKRSSQTHCVVDVEFSIKDNRSLPVAQQLYVLSCFKE